MKRHFLITAALATVLGAAQAQAEHGWGLNDDYKHGAPTVRAMGGKAGPAGGNIDLNDEYGGPGPRLLPAFSCTNSPKRSVARTAGDSLSGRFIFPSYNSLQSVTSSIYVTIL